MKTYIVKIKAKDVDDRIKELQNWLFDKRARINELTDDYIKINVLPDETATDLIADITTKLKKLGFIVDEPKLSDRLRSFNVWHWNILNTSSDFNTNIDLETISEWCEDNHYKLKKTNDVYEIFLPEDLPTVETSLSNANKEKKLVDSQIAELQAKIDDWRNELKQNRQRLKSADKNDASENSLYNRLNRVIENEMSTLKLSKEKMSKLKAKQTQVDNEISRLNELAEKNVQSQELQRAVKSFRQLCDFSDIIITKLKPIGVSNKFIFKLK